MTTTSKVYPMIFKNPTAGPKMTIPLKRFGWRAHAPDEDTAIWMVDLVARKGTKAEVFHDHAHDEWWVKGVVVYLGDCEVENV